jgi:transaldolase
MSQNPLRNLQALGQSIWIDFISRGMITSGELQRLIEDDGVSGVTSNPSIFEKAITGSDDYDEAIRALTSNGSSSSAETFQALAIDDIQRVADLLRSTYDRTDGRDGFVSLEVSPTLAHDTTGTIAEARELWVRVNRPNVMIKVPATAEGIPAIRELIGEEINVNITLLFGLPRYKDVLDAYLGGLEILADRKKPLKQVASVASFFLSRIDTIIDPVLQEIIKTNHPQADIARRLQGQAAIASAKIAYEIYKEILASDRFARLTNKGARTQKLLWASTSTKNPAYTDTKYVEALIGPDTINTVPVETLDAYRDHGHPERILNQEVHKAHDVLNELASVGIDLDAITHQLEAQGVEKFVSAFERLMNSIRKKKAAVDILDA